VALAAAVMWQVIHTADRLVDAGKLTKEPGIGDPTASGGAGPSTFVWWPNSNARRQAEQHAAQQAAAGAGSGRLRGEVRANWVPPFRRQLPDGYRASEEARDAYAAHQRALHGPDADSELPSGYTWVTGFPRGGTPGRIWVAVNALQRPDGRVRR
jgi:hypothetical protein